MLRDVKNPRASNMNSPFEDDSYYARLAGCTDNFSTKVNLVALVVSLFIYTLMIHYMCCYIGKCGKRRHSSSGWNIHYSWNYKVNKMLVDIDRT